MAKGFRATHDELPIAFVRRNRDGVGEVDRAGVRARHRNLEEAVGVALVEARRESVAFVAEDKRVARFEDDVVERLLAVGREEEDALRPLGREIVLPRVVDRLLEMRPVVESRPGDGLVVELKAERTHQVQLHAESDAEPSDRPRVVRNLGTEEHDGKFFSHVDLS